MSYRTRAGICFFWLVLSGVVGERGGEGGRGGWVGADRLNFTQEPPKLADVSKAACVLWALNHDPTQKGPGKIIEVGEDGIRQLAAVPLLF